MSLKEVNYQQVEVDRNNELEKFVTQRMVVKIGSSTLTGGTNSLDIPFMNQAARQLSTLYHHGVEILLVTSGAVVLGAEKLEETKTIRQKQKAAVFGQARLMKQWSILFENWGVDNLGQLLVTEGDLVNVKEVLNDSLKDGIVVANANDPVNSSEMLQLRRSADNDKLAGFLRETCEADTLLLLTDVDGLMDRNGNVISTVNYNEETTEVLSLQGKSSKGTGGILSKHRVACEQTSLNTRVIIGNGREPNIILRVAQGESVGTEYFRQ